MSTGHGVFTAEYAQHSLESLDPIRSLTIPFAALTGVLLWLSSLMRVGLRTGSCSAEFLKQSQVMLITEVRLARVLPKRPLSGLSTMFPVFLAAFHWLSYLLVGALNFGVSFALALFTACRARNVKRFWMLTFLAATVRRFLKHPFEFFFK
jgi:site-specific recombinase